MSAPDRIWLDTDPNTDFGGCWYNAFPRKTPDGEAYVPAARLDEAERLLAIMCVHWDENLNNLDCGEEFETRQDVRTYLEGIKSDD